MIVIFRNYTFCSVVRIPLESMMHQQLHMILSGSLNLLTKAAGKLEVQFAHRLLSATLEAEMNQIRFRQQVLQFRLELIREIQGGTYPPDSLQWMFSQRPFMQAQKITFIQQFAFHHFEGTFIPKRYMQLLYQTEQSIPW